MDLFSMRSLHPPFAIETAAETKPTDNAEATTRCRTKYGPAAKAVPKEECEYTVRHTSPSYKQPTIPLLTKHKKLLHPLHHPRHRSPLLRLRPPLQNHLPTNRLGRPTHQIRRPRRPLPGLLPRRHRRQAHPDHHLPPPTHHLRRLHLRHPALEVHPAAARGPRPPRRDRARLLYCHEPE